MPSPAGDTGQLDGIDRFGALAGNGAGIATP